MEGVSLLPFLLLSSLLSLSSPSQLGKHVPPVSLCLPPPLPPAALWGGGSRRICPWDSGFWPASQAPVASAA